VRLFAKTISDKYISPPHTTDFALLYLPTEGLYAEVISQSSLIADIQNKHRVVVVGPTTLSALLNSLQMGFRTLAIQQRSSEVWTVLAAVKAEFSKFGETLANVKKRIDSASAEIDRAGTRTRAIARKLRDVEALPTSEAARLLPELPDDEAEEAAVPD
jgi:DNA recombination protein RmuC